MPTPQYMSERGDKIIDRLAGKVGVKGILKCCSVDYSCSKKCVRRSPFDIRDVTNRLTQKLNVSCQIVEPVNRTKGRPIKTRMGAQIYNPDNKKKQQRNIPSNTHTGWNMEKSKPLQGGEILLNDGSDSLCFGRRVVCSQRRPVLLRPVQKLLDIPQGVSLCVFDYTTQSKFMKRVTLDDT